MISIAMLSHGPAGPCNQQRYQLVVEQAYLDKQYLLGWKVFEVSWQSLMAYISCRRRRRCNEGFVTLSITKLETVSRSWSSCLWFLQTRTALVLPAWTLRNPRTRSPLPMLPNTRITANEQKHHNMQQSQDAWDESWACTTISNTSTSKINYNKFLDRTLH